MYLQKILHQTLNQTNPFTNMQLNEKRLADLAMTFAKNALTTAKSQPAIDAKTASKINELKEEFEQVQDMQNNVKDILVHISSIQKSMKRKFDQLSKLTEEKTRDTVINDDDKDESPTTPETLKKPKAKKREPTEYNLFVKDFIAELRAKHPELVRGDLMKEAAAAWRQKKSGEESDDINDTDSDDYDQEEDPEVAQQFMEEGRLLCEQFRQGVAAKRMRIQ